MRLMMDRLLRGARASRVRRRLGARRIGSWWLLLCGLLAVAGSIGAWLGARAVANSVAAGSKRSLSSSAAQIASGLGLAIQREADVTTSTAAFVALNPGLSQAQFAHWLDTERTHENYPELATVALVRIVPEARLRAFERRAVAPALPTGGSAAAIFPAGRRAFYCLTGVGVGWGFFATPPSVWIDACALPGIRAVVLAARDSGAASYVAAPYLGQNVLEVETPVYRSSALLTPVASRRRAFVGWLGETILPNVILTSALLGHPGTALTVRYRASGYEAAFSAGHAPPRAGRVSVALQGGWTAEVAGPLATASIFKDPTALGLLAGGIALSITLSALLFVLASGRARAHMLVRQKTGELAHLAMHDALTGLPNRLLALDRAEQLLARARRTGRPIAALYIDIDGFKQINDTFGHATGDQFLKLVAERLVSVVRESDTAARLAGDEFLVLLDCQNPDIGPELVAERLLDVLREPYTLGEQTGRPLTLTASIGIAQGQHTSAEQLLADADLAMYAAKTAGKNRYVTFRSAMQTASQDRLELELDLADALATSQLFLVYQPIFDLASEHITGVEALCAGVTQPAGSFPPPRSSRSPNRPARSLRSGAGSCTTPAAKPHSGAQKATS